MRQPPGVRVRPLCAVLAVLVLAGSALAGPTGGTIAGVVRNGSTAQPVAGSPVQLIFIGPGGAEAVAQARSDTGGRFRFEGVPDGRYLLQARHQGVTYATHVMVSGAAAVEAAVQVFDASPQVPLRVGLLGMAVDVQTGYVRISEVQHLQNPTTRTLFGAVVIHLPRGARYVTFLDGFHQPQAEGAQITDRLIVRPGGHQLAYAYTVPGSVEVALDRRLPLPTDRVELFVAAPAEARSPRLQGLPTVTNEGRTYTRASARAVPVGDFALTIVGVPRTRLWLPPVAAGTMAALLVVGLIWAVVREELRTGRRTENRL